MRASRIVPAAVALLAASPLAVVAQEEGAAGGGGGIFSINVGLSVWTIVVFLGLVFILGKFVWPLILGPLEAREGFIQGALDDAARQNEEAQKLLDEQRKQLANARRQASEFLAQGKVTADKVRKEIEEKAREEAQGIVDRAREEIERERDAALDTLRKESVDLALAAAAYLLRERLDQAEDRTLIERYLEELPESEGAQA